MNIFDRISFTEEHAKSLSSIVFVNEEVKFVIENTKDILIRVNTVSLTAENIDSFVMETSAFPNDEIVYTSSNDAVDLSKRDGGFF